MRGDDGAPGIRRRSSSATARSWDGSRNANSRQTATASASSSGSDVEVEWLEHAVRPDPLPHAEAALEGHERLGMVGAQPVQVCAVLAPQMEEMLETRGRDERRARALALEQRVRRHRRPVGEALELLRADGASRGDHRLLLSRRGRNLGRPQLSAVQQDGVGKGPADVDAEKGHAKREPTRWPRNRTE